MLATPDPGRRASRRRRITLPLLAAALWAASLGPSPAATAADFQYSVPVPTVQGRRAYLWVPPGCARVRGLLFCLNNMLEERIVLDPTIRATAAELGMGIVWVQPGGEPKGGSPLDIALRYGKAAEAVQQVLTDLANESGYAEVRYAPLVSMQHSAASPFVYGIQDQMPDRIIAAIPIKGWYPGWWRAQGIPNLQVASVEGEHGTGWSRRMWQKDVAAVAQFRAQDPRCLIGQMVDVGTTHFYFTPASAGPIAMFIRKAFHLRVPADTPADGPVHLNPIDPASGWLIPPDKLGTPDGTPIPAAQWQGDPAKALWYFDREMATTVNRYMLNQVTRKPQFIDVLSDGKPLPLDGFRKAEVPVRINPDGVTFDVAAGWYDHNPCTQPVDDTPVGHGPDPIEFTASSGALDPVGPATFQVAPHRGVVLNQGNPWEPFVVAHVDGDADYARSQRPLHVHINVLNRKGEEQTLDFPEVADQRAGHLSPVKLGARASSGLPVQYVVVSGPCIVAGDTLAFDAVPPRTRFPMRVLVSAFQWGRVGASPVRSAGPVTREFRITK